MIPILAAFQFLTIMPAVVRRPFSAKEMGRAVGWYPFVGLGLGGLLFGLQGMLRHVFPAALTAALTLSIWVVLTRALHLDGLVDSFDALFGGFTPERRLEIMKDPRIGTFGMAGGVLLLLTKFTVLMDSPRFFFGLLLAPVVGRWVVSLTVFAYPYAREKGLGRGMKDNVGWSQIVLATLTALAAAWVFGGWMGFAALTTGGLAGMLASGYILRLIPGLTGDSYGALCEGAEMLVLLVFMGLDHVL